MGQPKVVQEYKPQFPQLHDVLHSHYSISEAKPRDDLDRHASTLAFEGMKDLFRVLDALRRDNTLPKDFARKFLPDVENVVARVHSGHGVKDLSHHHSPIAIGMVNLDAELLNLFG